MIDYIKKFMGTIYGKGIAALLILISGGTVTFQMLSTDEVTEPLKDNITNSAIDVVSEMKSVKRVLGNVSEVIEKNPVIDKVLSKVHSI